MHTTGSELAISPVDFGVVEAADQLSILRRSSGVFVARNAVPRPMFPMGDAVVTCRRWTVTPAAPFTPWSGWRWVFSGDLGQRKNKHDGRRMLENYSYYFITWKVSWSEFIHQLLNCPVMPRSCLRWPKTKAINRTVPYCTEGAVENALWKTKAGRLAW